MHTDVCQIVSRLMNVPVDSIDLEGLVFGSRLAVWKGKAFEELVVVRETELADADEN